MIARGLPSFMLTVLGLFLIAPGPGGVQSKEILVLLPHPSYSHTMPFMPIFKELGKRGHRLTMVTPYPQEPTPKGFKQVTVPINITDLKDYIFAETGRKPKPGVTNDPMFQMFGLTFTCPVIGKFLLENVRPYLPPPDSKFDLIFIEPFFCMEPLVATGLVFNAPVIATLPNTLIPIASVATGNPLLLSYVPNAKIPIGHRMNFIERVWNTIVSFADIIASVLYHYPSQDRLMRQYLPYKDLPYITDMLSNISLVLTSTHFSMNYQRPYARNVLEVGGVATLDYAPLTPELEKYMEEAEHGVILFSWGSYYEAENIDDILIHLLKAFSQLKQRVILKWPYIDVPNVPKNVLMKKWVPQMAILNHKKTVLFVSHCGMSSIYEAAYYGVPIVGTPLFSDQPHNAKIVEGYGMAVRVPFNELKSSHEGVLKAINTVLADPSYKANAMKRMRVLRDRPMPPLDEAVYWVEYIMKHGGAELTTVAKELPWYSLALLDVIGFFFAVITLVVYLVTLPCRRKKKPLPEKKKKN